MAEELVLANYTMLQRATLTEVVEQYLDLKTGRLDVP